MNTFILIRECGGSRRDWISSHPTDNADDAIDRALAHHFGSDAAFVVEPNLTPSPHKVRMGHIRGSEVGGRVAIEIFKGGASL